MSDNDLEVLHIMAQNTRIIKLLNSLVLVQIKEGNKQVGTMNTVTV